MKMRIVHVASGREWRGGQNQVRLLSKALQKRDGIEQVVITGRGSVLAQRLAEASVPVRAAGWSAALDPRALLAVIAEAREGNVILHAHDAHALVLGRVAASLTGARLIVTRRVDFHLRRPSGWKGADRIVAISEAIRAILISDGIPEGRVTVVHSGIDPAEVQAAPPGDLRKRYGLAPDIPLALNLAALVPHKDHHTLITAAKTIRSDRPDLHWVIAGEGPLRAELIERVAREGLTDRVHFAGHIGNPWGALAEADIFVMSSKEEGLGTSILDAMAQHVPVVATRAGGIPEILEGGAGILVPVQDGEGLGQAVRSLLDNSALREATVQRADQGLLAFTHDAMAERMLTVYRSLVPTG